MNPLEQATTDFLMKGSEVVWVTTSGRHPGKATRDADGEWTLAGWTLPEGFVTAVEIVRDGELLARIDVRAVAGMIDPTPIGIHLVEAD